MVVYGKGHAFLVVLFCSIRWRAREWRHIEYNPASFRRWKNNYPPRFDSSQAKSNTWQEKREWRLLISVQSIPIIFLDSFWSASDILWRRSCRKRWGILSEINEEKWFASKLPKCISYHKPALTFQSWSTKDIYFMSHQTSKVLVLFRRSSDYSKILLTRFNSFVSSTSLPCVCLCMFRKQDSLSPSVCLCIYLTRGFTDRILP